MDKTFFDVKKEWDYYGKWLAGRVGMDKKNYTKLTDFLHSSPFLYYIERDHNRYDDGIYLREMYCMEKNIPNFLFEYYECRVLEMLVALSIRIDNEWIGSPGEERPDVIFWEMLGNLGLDKCTNRKFHEDFVRKTIGIWIKREFDRDGTGSIFPNKGSSRNQRELEIWIQMLEYVSRYH